MEVPLVHEKQREEVLFFCYRIFDLMSFGNSPNQIPPACLKISNFFLFLCLTLCLFDASKLLVSVSKAVKSDGLTQIEELNQFVHISLAVELTIQFFNS